MKNRKYWINKIKKYLLKKSFPRIQMGIILILTGIFGFICSTLLLKLELNSMWLRYGIAVIFAYCLFLFFVWIVLKSKKENLLDDPDILDVADGVDVSIPSESSEFVGEGGDFGGAGADADFDTVEVSASSSWDIDIDVGIDLDEIIIILLFIAAVVAGLAVSVYLVVTAPTLFAELILDTALCSGLYSRLRKRAPGNFLPSALKRTIKPFLIVFVFFIVFGIVVQIISPEAKSLGDVISIIHVNS